MWNDINLNVDIKKKNHHYVEVNQGDDLRIYVYLYDNGNPINLVEGEDTVICNYVNANNTVTADSDIGKKFTKNIAILYFPKNSTNSAGTAHMQVTINTNKQYVVNKQTTSFPIDIKICRSVVDGKEVSQNVNSMIDAMNKATIEGNKVIKNIEETASKYPGSSQLYSDVQSLNIRKMGSINLLRDAGFISGNIGSGFDWLLYNTDSTTAEVVEDSDSFSGYCAKITIGDTIYRGIYQNVLYEKGTKYIAMCKIKGTAGHVVKLKLSGSEEEDYTIKTNDTWENVSIKFSNETIPQNWNGYFCIYGMTKGTFYISNPMLVEGNNPVTFSYNPLDMVGESLDISKKDVLEIEKTGFYRGDNCINAPKSNMWFYYSIFVHNYTYKKIVAYSYNNNEEYHNTMQNGTWSGWKQLTTQTLAKNPSNITQDSTHRFVTDAEKNKWNMVTGSGTLQSNSYCKLPNGLIMQWGTTSIDIESGHSATKTVIFPTSFPNKAFTIQANVNRNISAGDRTGCENIIINGTLASGIDTDRKQATIFARDCIGSGSNWTFEIGWFAIGY